MDCAETDTLMCTGWEVIKAESDTQVSPDCENYEDSLSPAEQSSAISALSPESDYRSTQSSTFLHIFPSVNHRSCHCESKALAQSKSLGRATLRISHKEHFHASSIETIHKLHTCSNERNHLRKTNTTTG